MSGQQWTGDDIAQLRIWIANGHSGGEISALFADGGKVFSRSAICGKAFRLGLKLGSPEIKARNAAEARKAKPARRSKPPKPVPAARMSWGQKASPKPVRPTFLAAPVEDIARVQMADLHDHHCRWPVGDPGTDGFGFCGHEVEPDRPYCAGHCARAFIPIKGKPGDLIRSLRKYAA